MPCVSCSNRLADRGNRSVWHLVCKAKRKSLWIRILLNSDTSEFVATDASTFTALKISLCADVGSSRVGDGRHRTAKIETLSQGGQGKWKDFAGQLCT